MVLELHDQLTALETGGGTWLETDSAAWGALVGMWLAVTARGACCAITSLLRDHPTLTSYKPAERCMPITQRYGVACSFSAAGKG